MNPRTSFRSIAALGLSVALYGCGQGDRTGNSTGGSQEDGWTKVPRIEGVRLSGRQAVIIGTSGPEDRVILRGDEGETYAVGADTKGHFELALTLSDESVVLVPEVQQGQNGVKGPQRLVILSDVALAVIQTDGGGSQRLTPGPALDAIDNDGQVMVASGRGQAGDLVRISVADRFTAEVKVGDDRRWSTGLPGVPNRAFGLRVNNQTFDYPGPGGGLEDEQNQELEMVNEGWRLTRRLGGRAFLTSWFPNP
jgi:hypothetical protein